jgi:hypothetical protein
MSVQTDARAALASIIAANSAGAVKVIDAAGTSASGFLSGRRGDGDLEQAGVSGAVRRTVWCSAASLSVERGNVIKVDGARVRVEQVRLDPVGALLAIQYEELE